MKFLTTIFIFGMLSLGFSQGVQADNFPGTCNDGILGNGNGNSEKCEDYNPNDNDDCISNCKIAECGDGILLIAHSVVPPGVLFVETPSPLPELETCDDGQHCFVPPTIPTPSPSPQFIPCDSDGDCFGIGDGECKPRSGDGCDENCLLEGAAVCGNGVHEAGEACDDGGECQPSGATPTPTPTDCTQDSDCDTNNCAPVAGDGCSDTCTKEADSCGNGIKEGSEECDDGNSNAQDFCKNNCTKNDQVPAGIVCGDGILQPPEGCDDGNTVDGDGCGNVCFLEGAANCGNCVPEALECGDTGTCTTDCEADCVTGGGTTGGTTTGGTTGGVPTPPPTVSGDDCSCNTNPMAFPAANFLGLLGLWMVLGVGYISTRFKKK